MEWKIDNSFFTKVQKQSNAENTNFSTYGAEKVEINMLKKKKKGKGKTGGTKKETQSTHHIIYKN